MTRPFNAQFHCNNCKTWQTQETAFGRWIRNNSKLDSRAGYVVTDQDYWIHRYRTEHGREFQLLMAVEIKTMGAELTKVQTDTLHIVNQMLRNRRQTPTKERRWQAGSAPLKVRSEFLGREVTLKALGMHVLTFSGLGPDDSDWIKWNRHNIDADTLTEILAFTRDPDFPDRLLDLRNHHPCRLSLNPVLPLDGAWSAAE